MHVNEAGAQCAPNVHNLNDGKPAMHALKDLFTTDAGLMSVGGIAFMLGMGVFFVRYFLRHMQEDGERAAAASAKQ
jgi:Protein of unknown function (DUF3149)